jgi:hypothetical protein
MSDSYDDYELQMQLAEHAWEKRVVKTEHDKQIEIAQAYERGWNAALAQQEPVAWISEGGDVSRSKRYMDEMGFKCNPLYTAPPPRQPLTDEMLRQMQNHCSSSMEMRGAFVDGWLSAEAAHGISIMSTKAQEE